MSKNFILNADDFGLTIHHNKAVLEGYRTEILTSASLCTNTDAFSDAVENVLPMCTNLGVGVHLNIMEGHALTDCALLTDNYGCFEKSYLYLILNRHNKNLLSQIKQEFKAQIEKALIHNVQIDHLDSHVHTHAIPEIFEITCELAKKYDIKYVRTQNEFPYIIKNTDLKSYSINFIKIMLLKYFTHKNKKTLRKYDLKTNDNIIGVGYTGMMSADAIISGVKATQNSEIIEALIHPCKYEKQDSHLNEFYITQNKNLKKDIENLGFVFANYKTF